MQTDYYASNAFKDREFIHGPVLLTPGFFVLGRKQILRLGKS